jgi:hypothetical protein
MIKPTNGRIVWYNPKPQDNLEQNERNDPLAAIVIDVLKEKEDSGNSRVSLFVFGASGQTRYMSRVMLWQGETEKPKGGYAEWMPYQLGQSAKTEQLEKQLHQQAQTQASGQQTSAP